jgi:hypothetical protein
MIDRVTIDGRSGVACYINNNFELVDEAQATLYKVVFDDGGQMFLDVRQGAPPPPPKRKALALREFDPNQPRDEDGKWTDGGGGGSSSGSGPTGADPHPDQGELFPDLPALPAAKGKIEVDDFVKAGVRLDTSTRTDPAKNKKFLERWNENVREAPEKFREEFLGGIEATMNIKYVDYEDAVEVQGDILDPDSGDKIGSYTRTIDFDENKAVSDYFSLNKTGKSIGKTVLAANVRMYQKLGIDTVEVHANIDVGGYAWAKYGYVPTDWDELSSSIRDKIDEMSGGGTQDYTPESWDELTSDQQDKVRDAWKDAARDEVYDQEVESWRDQGGDLAEAKSQLASNFDGKADGTGKWLWEGAKSYAITVGEGDDIKGQSLGPFLSERGMSVEQVMHETTIDYSDKGGEGAGDPDIGIQWHNISGSEKLTNNQREQIEELFIEVFNKQAEKERSNTDPPEWINDSLDDTLSEAFDGMRDRDKYKWADDNGHLPSTTETTGSGEMDESDADHLRHLADSSDPKAVWAIADSEYGKQLLLGTDWNGVLDLGDKETMDRFNAYVGQKPKG